ncbi:MAG: polysaccharide pyruvyl transferase family protein [Moorea sp. SIO2B7]|nr:polysaccharide pyruvyl transferase family protein [Moorena sp. SIO2B7]
MKVISLLDPSICSSNLGDQIIIDSVDNIIEKTFEESLVIRIQTQDKISKNSYKYIMRSDLKIIGGTNLLSSNMNSYKQWKVNLWDSLFINDIILLGVGWWQYQKKPNFYTRFLYKVLLSNTYIHSVRDSYTEQQLKSIGIPNVVNTSCPTLWTLTGEHCSNIPRKKSDSVLVTFTEYHQNEKLDFQLVNLLSQKYQKIYFWTQQPKDYQYMQSFCGNSAIYLKPSLKALDQFLSSSDVDYVGTRLHAGIRALQHSRRSLIVAIDNRAAEIAKDTNLPVLKRDDIESIENWIDSSYETKIKLPIENINRWKNQF